MNYKIKVHSKAESRLVQEHAFKLGCAWQSGSVKVQHEEAQHLNVRKMRVSYTLRDIDFGSNEYTEISVDDFLELESLEGKIENSRGQWVASVPGAYKDELVLESEVRDARRFDTEEQAEAAHKDIQKVLNVHQVANAIGLDITLAYKSIEGENDKNIDRFKAAMKRRGFYE